MTKHSHEKAGSSQRNDEAIEILKELGLSPRQSNKMAAYVLLALPDLDPEKEWREASNPLRGIAAIMEFIHKNYQAKYAPNTRESIRDEAVKHFVEAGTVIRNPDDPARPVNSGKTVYQVEPHSLELFRSYHSRSWGKEIKKYLLSREKIQDELSRNREMTKIPVTLPDKKS